MSDRAPTWNESGEMEPTLPAPIAKAVAYFRAMSEPYFNAAILDDAEHQLRLAILDHAPNPYIVQLALLFWVEHHKHEEQSAYGREVRKALNAVRDQISALERRYASPSSSAPTPRACDYARVTPGQTHGPAKHSVRGYKICEHCYTSMRAAEDSWEKAQDAANHPASSAPTGDAT